MQTILLLVLSLVLTACEQATQTTGNSALQLTRIGNKEVAAGDSFSLLVQATDSDGNALHYTSDGSIGPGKNPYAQTTPAIFDLSAARFEWTPTSAELGDYSVQFTVTNSTVPPLSSSETISITVMTTTAYGRAMYMQSLQESLSARDLEHIAEYLMNLPHIQYELSLGCVICHDGALNRGKSGIHPLTSELCGACHTLNAWLPLAKFDHTQTSAACTSCHNTSLGHPSTTDQCAACHTLDTWQVLKVDHNQITGPCSECHHSLASP
ncbi:MAG: hypothetical protein HY273_00365 [Gammaproteobacteria bacterium]|nr:hypothetical protein [Gammaproteobacteria bacterium]